MTNSEIREALDAINIAALNSIKILYRDEKIFLSVEDGKVVNENIYSIFKAKKKLLLKYFKNIKLNEEKSLPSIIKRSYSVSDFVPLSYGQERLWFIDKLQGSIGYHLPVFLPLTGDMDQGVLERALRAIVERHEVLRTVIREHDGVGYQEVITEDAWSLGNEQVVDEQALAGQLQSFVSRPFDLSADYMLRASFYKVEGKSVVLVVVLHHIASDGWSNGILMNEFEALYNALKYNAQSGLSPLPLQYRDYAIWQRRYVSGEYLERQLVYWEDQLAGAPTLQLPADYPRPAVQSMAGAALHFRTGKELSTQLNALSQEEGVTPFIVLLSAFVVLLERYSGQEDICVGTPVANRTQQELEGMIGFFVNTLVVRSDVSGNPTFLDLLKRITTSTLEAYDHTHAPFEKVVERVVKERDMSRSPLVQVMFTLENLPEGYTGQQSEELITITQFDLSLTAQMSREGISYRIVFCTDLFSREKMARMGRHYEELLRNIVANRHKKIGELLMLTSDEEELLIGFNKTDTDYPADKTFVELFQDQVEKTPDQIAVIHERTSMTYRQLDEQSNQLAGYLQGLGVGPEVLVPVCIERSVEMLVGMLGILKAGGVYVPIDPSYPLERISYMLEDTGAHVIVSSTASRKRLSSHEGRNIILLDGDAELISQWPVAGKMSVIHASNLAYIIYTSGSTGRPRGVGVEHGNLRHFLSYIRDRYLSSGSLHMPLVASYSFDISLFQLCCAVLSGGSCLVAAEEDIRDLSRFTRLLKQANSIDTVPAVYQALVNHLEAEGLEEKMSHIEVIFIGGDVITDHLLERLRKTFAAARIVVTYGPTEGTIFCTDKIYEVSGETTIGRGSYIGRPIGGSEIYITDTNNRLTPIGVPGELCIGGFGVSRGYINEVELTHEKFIISPFHQHKRLYRTGDLGRWLPDGDIEFIGRNDEQVKVRGYRIELSEIESVLSAQAGVKACCVMVREDRLVGYVVMEAQWNKQQLEQGLRNLLPEYMLPRVWVQLEALPLTPNGKIDRKALREPSVLPLSDQEYVPPRSDVEEQLAAIWSGLLGVERVGIHDNFFALGGDSIITIQVVSRAQKQGITLRPRDLFEKQTIAELSAYVGAVSSSDGEQGLLEGTSDLLPVQHYFFEQGFAKPWHFNQSVLLRIEKGVPATTLQQLSEVLFRQHDSLRFRYNNSEGKYEQRYGPVVNCFYEETTDPGSIGQVCEHYQRSLDLKEGPLFKIVLIRTLGDDPYNRLFMVAHHLVIDGVSWRILVEDIENGLTMLQSDQTPVFVKKSDSCRAYVKLLQEFSHSKLLEEEEWQYWNTIVKNCAPLRTDKPVNIPCRITEVENCTIRINTDWTSQLIKGINQVYQTDINDLLLAALGKTLSNYQGSTSIVFGLEGHGREAVMSEELNTSRTVGWFTNMFPVRLELETAADAGELLKSVKEQLRAIPGKGMGFGVLRYLHKSEDIRRSLQHEHLYDVVFNYLGQVDNVISNNRWLQAAPERSGQAISADNAFDHRLSVNSYIGGGELVINWNYDSLRYEAATIKQLAEDYEHALHELITHCRRAPGRYYTPSDFELAEAVSYQELDKFLGTQESTVRPGELYALSGLQEGLLFHELYNESAAYIIQTRVRLKTLDVELVRKSWQYLLEHYSILRTSFYYKELNIPVQRVHQKVSLPMEELDLRSLSAQEQEIWEEQFLKEDRGRGFDVTVVPLMRITILLMADDDHRLIWTMHHLLLDGWSVSRLMGEFLQLYRCYATGSAVPQKAEDRYGEYIRYIGRIDRYKEEAFWRKYLQDYTTPVLLPFVRNGKERNKGLGEYAQIRLELYEKETTLLKEYAQRNRITMNTFIQGVWALLLSRYSGQEDVAFGVTVSGRPAELAGTEDRVGMYINMLPLRSKVSAEMDLADWLTEIQAGQSAAREYQYGSLRRLQQRYTGIREDWFDSIVTFENYPVSDLLQQETARKETAEDEHRFQATGVQTNRHTNYLLSMGVTIGSTLVIDFLHNNSLFEEGSMERIKGHFARTLRAIGIEAEKKKVGDIDILTAAEEEELLAGFNSKIVEYPAEKTLVYLFEAQVQRTPDLIAVVYETARLTYRELDELSNQLSHYLRRQGVTKNTLTCICMDRSLQMIVGIIGIMKAGGVYVPVDPQSPNERKQYIISDTAVKLIITDKDNAIELPVETECKIVLFQDELFRDEPITRADADLQPENLAYVIYTSGSTGKPKGVLIEHGSVANELLHYSKFFNFSPGDKQLLIANYIFDGSIEQIFLSLVNGGTLVLTSKETMLDTRSLEKVLFEESITHLQATPSFMKEISPGRYANLKRVCVGGEACPVSLAKSWSPYVQFFNKYGPTETTVNVTCHSFDPLGKNDTILPLGKPLHNVLLYVLGTQRELLPLGAVGEIYVGGVQLGRGYLNQPELTHERFVQNTFTKGDRLYRTGDIGRWLPDGNIEFLGRKDDQVKIRGYRIELGEIEGVLMDQPGVKSCCVLAREDGAGDKRLTGYVVTEGEWNKQRMEERLLQLMPEYMVPRVWVELETLPLTPNGKIDKKALPDAELSGLTGSTFVAPRNAVEEQLAAIWSELLGVERIGIYDNFFELGGHSLLATRLVALVRSRMDTELAIRDVFTYPVLSTLAAHLATQKQGRWLPVILPAEEGAHIPLSYGQERLWFIDKLQGSMAYHMPTILKLTGDVDRDLLERSLRAIVEQHEVLRTVIREQDGVGYQEVITENNWSLDHEQVNDEQELKAQLRTFISRPFDLSADYMLRACLFEKGKGDYILAVVLHHIASDGWSNGILKTEFTTLYNAFREGKPSGLPPLALQYCDYAVWQRRYIAGEYLEQQLTYWEQRLAGAPALQLPTDYPRPVIQSMAGEVLSFRIDKMLSEQLNESGREEGATLYMVLLSAFVVLLERYSGQEDICIGTPVANRTQQELEGMIGFFVNTLVIRSDLDGDPTFTELLSRIKTSTLEAYDHQQAPFEKVVERVVKERDMSRSPLFQVKFQLNNIPALNEEGEGEEGGLEGLSLSPYAHEHTALELDLSLDAVETAGGIVFSMGYCTDLFSRDRIRQMARHYEELLRSIAGNRHKNIGGLSMLTGEEEKLLLIDFNKTATDYPADRTVMDLFEEQVKKTPGQIAVIHERGSLTYRQLNERANRLAHHLRQTYDIGGDDRVAVMLDRSEWLLVAMLGVMKAGAAYVPVDKEYPQSRKSFMLTDSRPKVLITGSQSEQEATGYAAEVLIIDGEWSKGLSEEFSLLNPERNIHSDNLAYIIYTSGSTGRPRGVLAEHRALVNVCLEHIEVLSMQPADRYLQFMSVAFDGSILDMFSTLLSGATLILPSAKVLGDRKLFLDFIQEQGVSMTTLTPSYLSILDKAELAGVHTIISAGEAVQKEDALHYSTGRNFYNAYGPSEGTINTTLYKVGTPTREKFNIPIGRPGFNKQVYIVKDQKELCPVGVDGEIWIGGAGLTWGYLNEVELTHEKFIASPFREGERLYRTGDMGRWLPDGNIEFIGRKDEQVKIRGYRIELGEIESVVSAQPGVKGCCVVAKEDMSGNKSLIGYVVTKGEQDKNRVEEEISKLLPEYMVPRIWVELEALPLTANGKIDKKALPDPSALPDHEYVAPRNEVEEQLAATWSELLGIEKISVADSFFELGGHSLLAMRLIALVRSRMDTELSVRDIFQQPVLGELSAHIAALQKGAALPAIVRTLADTPAPLSYGQERLWFIDKLQGSTAYHIPTVLQLSGEVNRMALECSLRAIVDRHEVLRTVIREQDGVGYQQVLPASGWPLDHEQVNEESALRTQLQAFLSRPFDLSADYMLRTCLFKKSEGDYILAVVLHHIASDGWSSGILEKEFMALYHAYCNGEQPALSPLALQYRDYAAWQRRYITGEYLEQQLGYWEQRLAGAPTLQLPTDNLRPAVQSMAAAMLPFQLDKELTRQLNIMGREEGVTLYMVLLSAFAVLLERYSGQQDICVGTPVANRTQQELEGMIGFFVNTLVIRSDLDGDPTFTELLSRIKTSTLEAYDHQQAPFEKVVERVVKERDMSRSPLFQVKFHLNNVADINEVGDEGEGGLEGLSLSPYEHGHTALELDLSLDAVETAEGIAFTIGYNTGLFSRERIRRMGRHYEELLRSIVNNRYKRLGEQSMLTADEHNLLANFNSTAVEYNAGITTVELFEAQAEKTPDRTAIVYEGESLTYRQLNERANLLAHHLRQAYDIDTEDRVAVMLARSAWQLVAALGVLKAGAAFVPIDNEYPKSRKLYMVSDSQPKVLITASGSVMEVSDYPVKALFLDIEFDELSSKQSWLLNPHRNIDAGNLAYVIYTSGSTGRPKGVLVEHRGLANTILSQIEKFHVTSSDHCLQFFSPSFDAFMSEIFIALVSGATLFIINEEGKYDQNAFIEYTHKHKITLATLPPAFFTLLPVTQLGSLHTLITAGEQAPLEQARLFSSTGRYINAYGPTESSICATTFEGMIGSKLPIGRPIANTKIYITDHRQQLVPEGVTGELYIGGTGLARGYLNEVELTHEKFVESPFNDGERLYRTGDLGRWMADGNIWLEGRADEQVKIRGYRIEPGEIENVLSAQAGVKGCCVVPKEDAAGNKRLVAYMVTEGGLEKKQLEVAVGKILPQYMVPQIWVELDALPLTANGKVDRKALPDPELTNIPGREYVAPRNDIEEKLVQIWEIMLGIEKVSVTDDFFELGGHSLMAARLVSMVRSKMNVELLIRDVFEHAVLSNQAEYIKDRQQAILESGNLSENIHLIKFQDQGTEPPIFILPGFMGFSDDYFELAKALGDEQPVYGVNMIGYYEGESPLSSIEEIAAINLKWIKEIRPKGPYRIIGHSLGGLVGYEMMRQLQIHEELKDNVLILLDTRPSKFPFYGHIESHVKELLKTGYGENLYELVKANLLTKYSAEGDIDCRTLLVLPEGQPAFSGPSDVSTSWSRIVKDISVVNASGDHNTMVKGQNAIKLARGLKEIMNGSHE